MEPAQQFPHRRPELDNAAVQLEIPNPVHTVLAGGVGVEHRRGKNPALGHGVLLKGNADDEQVRPGLEIHNLEPALVLAAGSPHGQNFQFNYLAVLQPRHPVRPPMHQGLIDGYSPPHQFVEHVLLGQIAGYRRGHHIGYPSSRSHRATALAW